MKQKPLKEDMITPDALVKPREIMDLIIDNSQDLNLSQFDKEQIQKIVLKAMADSKIVERKDIPTFISIYQSISRPLN